ncbi:hypothetical protein HDZ31DRAFT_81390 [Schizophyllum fasciatum]
MDLHRARGGTGSGLPPLPPEGQPERVPWMLGGKRGKVEDGGADGDFDEDDAPAMGVPGRVLEPPRTWKEGWYLWSMGGLSAFWNHTHQMSTTLDNVGPNGQVKRPPRRLPARPVQVDHEFDNHTEEQLLIPLPPDTPPIIEPVKKFLRPSRTALNLAYDSIVEGHQAEFFRRCWEKAQTAEPWLLGYNSVKRFYTRWKQNNQEEDENDQERR